MPVHLPCVSSSPLFRAEWLCIGFEWANLKICIIQLAIYYLYFGHGSWRHQAWTFPPSWQVFFIHKLSKTLNNSNRKIIFPTSRSFHIWPERLFCDRCIPFYFKINFKLWTFCIVFWCFITPNLSVSAKGLGVVRILTKLTNSFSTLKLRFYAVSVTVMC